MANDLHGMATFENLINAYSGPDGAETLAYAINRFAVLGRHHARPLRVVVVNPPDAPRLLARIVKVLKQRRTETLPCLSLELFATPDHVARIQAALRFSGEERELLEEQISAGRLRFRAHEKPRKLLELIAELKVRPCHLLAIFDEATIRIRRRGAGRNLPMSPFCVRHEITFDKRDNAIRLEPTSDEPPFSEFMIGQNEAVDELVRQMNYARARKRRFSDKLLVGPAGVGKSSLARAIARKLLNDEEILFNGADLKSPATIVARLRERKKLPSRLKGKVKVQPCLLFIDEVHAISSAVQTMLLSAMDDERTAPIDGVVYDFADVVFILATTDPGRLSEAFNSRPDKTYLRSYTLEEMAGIIWLHGREKENLNGHELPRDVCLEIAARMRCNPRRAVRCLTARLLPYFHSQTHRDDEKLDVKRLARAITHEAVCRYFDEQGIDLNGLDVVAKNYLNYLARNGATPEERLRQGLGITNRGDFIEIEVDEFLSQRLGLVTISSAGRALSPQGRKYLTAPFDLRDRISRQR